MWGWWKYDINLQNRALMMLFSIQKYCTHLWLSCISVTVSMVPIVIFILKLVSFRKHCSIWVSTKYYGRTVAFLCSSRHYSIVQTWSSQSNANTPRKTVTKILGQTYDWSGPIGSLRGEWCQISMSKSCDSTVTSIIGGGWTYIIGILSGSDDDVALPHEAVSSWHN